MTTTAEPRCAASGMFYYPTLAKNLPFVDDDRMKGTIELHPIGVVHSKLSQDEIRERRRADAVLEVYEEFEAGLVGIEGFSHIFVIGYFDQLRPEQVGPLQVKPRGLLRHGIKLEDLPTMGVFALDSPTRPNPIGLTLVELLAREGRELKVSGLDFFDATPILDIKPYQPQYRTDGYKLPGWYAQLSGRAGHV